MGAKLRWSVSTVVTAPGDVDRDTDDEVSVRRGRNGNDPHLIECLWNARPHVRKKPSTSLSAQASVFSIGSPCM